MQTALQLVAWSGAAVFAVSLLWFLYSYVVRYGVHASRPAWSSSLPMAILIDVLLFSAFALHHSLFARAGLKARIQRLVRPELERSVYVWVASLVFLAVCTWWQPVPRVFYQLHGIWRLLAYVGQFLGVVLTVRASQALDALDLAGVRPVLTAADRTPRHVPLETGGLYGFVRHPLYFAWALFVFTTPDMTGTRALFAIISTGYLALAIPWEERSLVATFGDAYLAYRRTVRWRMIPGLY